MIFVLRNYTDNFETGDRRSQLLRLATDYTIRLQVSLEYSLVPEEPIRGYNRQGLVMRLST